MTKKVCAVALAVALAVTMMATGFSALRASAEERLTFTVATVDGAKGDIVELPVSVSENSYLVNMDVYVYFNTDEVAIDKTYYTDCDDPDSCNGYLGNSEILKGGWMYLGNEVEPGVFRFVAATGGAGLTKGGELFWLAFEILTDEVESIEIAVAVDPCVTNNGSGDVETSYESVNGGVNVETLLMGDYDANGSFNMRDIMQMYKAVSEGGEMTEYQIAVSDYDGNGSVNMRDVMKLYQIYSGAI